MHAAASYPLPSRHVVILSQGKISRVGPGTCYPIAPAGTAHIPTQAAPASASSHSAFASGSAASGPAAVTASAGLAASASGTGAPAGGTPYGDGGQWTMLLLHGLDGTCSTLLLEDLAVIHSTAAVDSWQLVSSTVTPMAPDSNHPVSSSTHGTGSDGPLSASLSSPVAAGGVAAEYTTASGTPADVALIALLRVSREVTSGLIQFAPCA